MTSQLNDKACRQPRSRQAPSQRDQQLYLDYQTTGQRQIDLAAQYKLTQCRISQIIRRVERWLTATLDLGPETLDSTARQRLERRLQYERLSMVGREALRHFHEQQKSVTHKTGTRADKPIDETTERLLPANLQCLKVVLQANAQLTRLVSSRHTPCAVNPTTPTVPSPSPATSTDEAPLSREHVEAWLLERNGQAARAGKVPHHFEANHLIHDLVDILVGEPTKGHSLHVLAQDAGNKVVQRRPYDDTSPPIPPHDGWYYGMYDADGGLVAWLHADQLAGAITPDYPPVSRSPPNPAPVSESSDVDSSSPDPAPNTPSDDSTSLRNTCSSTSASTIDPPQPACAPALTPVSPPTQFPAQYEPQPFDLQITQPTFHVKGCSH